MNAQDYQAAAMRTGDPRQTTGMRLSNAALGLAGEAGEVCDVIKKHLHHGHGLDAEHLANELGDVLWYVAQACDALGLTMDEVMRRNIDKLLRRYPDGFSHEASLNRKV